ncbi:prolipoprotein diacylglyceryl transferase [Spiroplasma endosymbiont of Aspidapion aeneum]|uniref:prolipoprotein diacylglyceryl transferase n=1 Tax=Spiroplasma endosymbiont of Aspidapion aeneum TaxID=3066276 RepID=UPI00313AD7BA
MTISLFTIDYSEDLYFMYPICALLGVLAAIIASAIKFKIRGMVIYDLIHSLYFIIPSGILGASFFGKIGVSQETDWKLWEYFFFWNPGMSFFGSLFFGTIAAIIFFYHRGKRRFISIFVYADCIAPNILLGQAIGRWGNLFNHEILGRPINKNEINWLPGWIWHRLFYFINPENGDKYTKIVYREPLFLYESIATISLWILLTFIVPNIGRLFSKKPWNIDPINFPCRFNKKYKSLPRSKIPAYSLQNPISYKTLKKNGELKLSVWSVWNKAYYYYEPDKNEVQKAMIDNDNIDNKLLKDINNYHRLKADLKMINNKKVIKINDNKALGESRKQIITNVKDLRKKIRRINYWRSISSKKLTSLHNPHNYLIVRSGLVSCLYLSFYSFIRMLLEYRRDRYEMFIKWNIGANYTFFILFFILGISLAFICQCWLPNKFRKVNWFYEKSY